MSIVADALLGLDVGWTNVRAVLERTAGQVASGPVLRLGVDDYPSFLATIRIVPAQLGSDAGVVGALLLAGQPVEESG